MDNCVSSAKMLLKLLGIRHTNRFLEDTILSHPDHPSLLSIADTLEKYTIETLAIKIDSDKLQGVPLPCIAQIAQRSNKIFSVLERISAQEIYHLNTNGKRTEYTRAKFLEKWTGICLLAETNENSKEPGIENRRYARGIMNFLKVTVVGLFLVSGILTFLDSGIIDSTITWYGVMYTLLKVVGLGTGILLLWYEVDQYNPTLQSFCSGGGNAKINCNAVLNSDKAQLFNGNLSLSLLGFAYFFGSLGFLLFSGFNVSAFGFLGMLSLAALPVVLLSAYYQAKVIKQWCRFCITLQGVLVFEIVVVLLGNFHKMPLAFENLPMLLALFFLPVLVWKFVKPLLDKEKETNLYKRGLKKIKNNPDVFQWLLVKSKKIITPVDDLGIIIKNKNAKYDVVKVCNPFCSACKRAHPVVEELLKKGKINLQIIFIAEPNSNDKMTQVVRHLLAINENKKDRDEIRRALNYWYNTKDKGYLELASKFLLNGELENQEDKIRLMRNWCTSEGIISTPTIYVNGHKLPREYITEDLKMVLH